MKHDVNSYDSHPSHARLVLALDRELDPEGAAEIHRHIGNCFDCRKRWEELRQVSEGIVTLHNRLDASRTDRPVIRRNLYVAAAGVAAAVMLALCGWLFSRGSQSTPVQVRADQQVKKDAPASVVNVVRTVEHKNVRRSAPRIRKREEVASFISLPFSDTALPLVDAPVVRVRLPMEQLRLAGLTVDADRAGMLVEADLLMGIDGLPRAIRLIQ